MQTFSHWLVAALLLTGTGGVSSPGWAAEDHSHVVVLRHGQFDPAEIEVEVGESVTWRHEDGDDPQSVTADDGSFDSHPDCREDRPEQCLQRGETFTHSFTEPGRVSYHSRTESMSGEVIVVEEHHDHEDH